MAWRHNMALLLAVVFQVGLAGCSSQPPPTADQFYDTARGALERKDFAEALDVAESGCEHYPEHLGIRFFKAIALHSMGRRADAIEEYDRVLMLLKNVVGSRGHPLAADIHYFRAKALFEDARWQAAINGLTNATARFAMDSRLANSLAWALATVPEAALRDARRSETIARQLCERAQWQNPGYMDTLAAAQAAAGRYSEAAAMVGRAIAITTGEHRLADYRNRLALYRAGKPYVAGR